MFNELISNLDLFVNGVWSRRQFSEWFYPLSRDIDRKYSGNIVQFAFKIQRILAEASSGNWPLESLRHRLALEIEEFRPVPKAWQFIAGAPPPLILLGAVPQIKFDLQSV